MLIRIEKLMQRDYTKNVKDLKIVINARKIVNIMFKTIKKY